MTVSPSPPDASDPRQKRQRSPWFYMAMGCGLLFVLTVGGCIAGITILGNRFHNEINKPLEPSQIIGDLDDIPIYQPSELDIEMTKVMRASMTFVPMGKPTAAAFRTTDTVDNVQRWYQQKLTDLGYQPAQNENNPLGETVSAEPQLQFVKDKQFVMVQPQVDPNRADGSVFILFKINMPDAQAQ